MKLVSLWEAIKMIAITKEQETYILSYHKVNKNEVYEMTKHDLEYYEIGQMLGGN